MIFVYAFLLVITAMGLTIQAQSVTSFIPSALVVERGSHYRVWQSVTSVTNASGGAIPQTNTFTELHTGLHYLQGTQWVESVAQFQPQTNGASALSGQHQVTLATNLNVTGALDLSAPDGQRFRGTPLALAYYDAATGQSVVIGEVQSVEGEIIQPNQVVYRNAFANIQAEVRYTYSVAGVEQTVVLQQNPPSPAAYGLDAATTRLEVWTEFQEAPPPRKESRVLKTTPVTFLGTPLAEPDLVDEALDFGAMRSGEGRAYRLDSGGIVDERVAAQQWRRIDGRDIFIEAAEYSAIRLGLEMLPGAGVTNGVAVMGRVLPAARMAGLATGPMTVSQGEAVQSGVALGWGLWNSDTNMTMSGDRTYYVSGAVHLSGRTTLEAGVVIKYTNSPEARINLWGPLNCQATAYRPVIFTAKDDNTVGEEIWGSSGSPAGFYGNPAVYMGMSGGGPLAHVRVAYAGVGIRWGPGGGYEVRHGQWVHCGEAVGMGYSDGSVRNGLIYDVTNVVSAGALGTLRGEHVTVNQARALNPGTNLTLYLTNSLLVGVSGTNTYSGQAIGVSSFQNRVFRRVKAGFGYLTTSSAYRNSGTTNINASLAAELKHLTTYAPVELYSLLPGQTILSPQVIRDTDIPDYGYHYDPIDYILGGLNLADGILLMTNGVVLAVYGSYGFNLQSGAQLYSEGSPTNMNRLVSYKAVQEQPIILGGNSPSQCLWQVASAPMSAPEIRLRFTDLPMLSDAPVRRQYLICPEGECPLGTLVLMDCQLRGGFALLANTNITRPMIVAMTNNILERVSLRFESQGAGDANPLSLFLRNNLFLRSTLGLPNGLSSGGGGILDNLFDQVEWSGPVTNITNGYNGYVNTLPLSGGVSNVVLTNFVYESGPLGNYYQASGDLIDQGSRTADQAGLYHYTTTTNQTKEANSRVDIGFHYMATRRQYQASTDYSPVQGLNQWYYRFSSMTRGWPDGYLNQYDDAWLFWGESKDAQCRIGRGFQQPGGQHDSVLTFFAPFAGGVCIRSLAALYPEVDGTNSVSVRILKNQEVIRPWTSISSATIPVSIDLSLFVNVGDAIHFQSTRNQEGTRQTSWDPVVFYLDSELQNTLYDADGDGLPDYIEDKNGNGVRDGLESDPTLVDTDHDGISDAQEFMTGTNPLDPADFNPASLNRWQFSTVDWAIDGVGVRSVLEIATAPMAPPTVSERGPHYRIWRSVTSVTNASGGAIPQTNTFTELHTGLHYLQGTQWVESVAQFQPQTNGASALSGQHQVTLATNLNVTGALDLSAPDGQRFRGTPLALAYYDASTGQSVVIGEVQSVEGVIVQPNQVVYRNAFANIQAEVRYTYSVAGVEQTVVLQQNPPSPAAYGLDAATTRLEVWTEFQEAPPPRKESRVLKTTPVTLLGTPLAEPDLVDEALDFGAMRSGEGRAYRLDSGGIVDERVAAQQWRRIDGRDIFIEAAEYSAIRLGLEMLPGAGVTNGVAVMGRVLPAARMAGLITGPMTVSQGEALQSGVALGWGLWNSDTNMTLSGDRTYYVSGAVHLSGRTTLEAGVVIKYTNSPEARINLWGPLNCQATAYRPVIFTAKDDNTVGEEIWGSSGSPAGFYGNPAVYMGMSGGGPLAHVRVAYAGVGIRWGPGGGYEVRHGQWVHCGEAVGMGYSDGSVRNGLIYDVTNVVSAGAVGTLRGEHVTVNQARALNPGTNLTLYLTNSLLVGVSGTNILLGEHIGISSNEGTVFTRSKAGYHYLGADSPFRNAGTTNINERLATELKRLTTYPPVELLYHFTGHTILAPQAPRDTGLPSLGYHYEPLDFVFSGLNLANSMLILTNGVVGCVYGDYGIHLQSGARFHSDGSPTELNRLVRYQAVQEQPITLGYHSQIQSLWRVSSASMMKPDLSLHFTDLPMLADSPARRQYLICPEGDCGVGALALLDCQLRGGVALLINTNGSWPTLVAMTNNIFERVSLSFGGQAAGDANSLSLFLRNNLFLRSALGLPNGGSSGSGEVFDNLFDQVEWNGPGANITNGYNGYVNTLPLSGGVSNVMLTNFVYESGPLGNYYQSSGDLIDQGSRLADQAGLFHYTTTTNQTKEANSRVDIGFHYVGMAAMWPAAPLDSNGDGRPDYLTDRNGNGLIDPGEIQKIDVDSDLDGRTDSQEMADGTNPLDPASFTRSRLGYWRFNNPDWLGEQGQSPLQVFNVSNQAGFNGGGLLVDNAALGKAVLRYRETEASGQPNINFRCGTVRFMFKPLWSSKKAGGQGLGHVARLWEMGDPDSSSGGMALSTDAAGDNLVFASNDGKGNRFEVSGLETSWSNVWYEITFSISTPPTSASNYVKVWIYDTPIINLDNIPSLPMPPAVIRANGFTLGSSADGSRQAQGQFDELETFNFDLGETGVRMNNNTLSAQVLAESPGINLQWRRGPNSAAILQRREVNETNWTMLTTNTAWGFSDISPILQPGRRYEYQIQMAGTPLVENRLLAGYKLPPVENRGSVVLLIDNTVASALATNLDQLSLDLVGDGWTVLRHEAPRHQDGFWQAGATNQTYLDNLASIKSTITNDYHQNSNQVNAVFIIGHVTIPYSGVAAEDGHILEPENPANHYGAWPADGYYGDIDGQWTDNSVNYTNLYNPVLQNLPGDGKFDQTSLPSSLELAVGRIDFAGLPAFSNGTGARTEIDLLRQYLDKDHKYRNGRLVLPDRTVIWGNIANENDDFYSHSIANASRWFGCEPDKVLPGDLFADRIPCLWGFQAGYGGGDRIQNGLSSQHTTLDLVNADNEPPIAFYMLEGSYFVDWNYSENNFMRATLATANYGLGAFWTRQGTWNLGTLALGETLGDVLLRTANDPAQTRSARTTYLLGDPTLRTKMIEPVTNLSVVANIDGSIKLTWDHSIEPDAKYLVYRSINTHFISQSDFVRITDTPISQNVYSDNTPLTNTTVYEVRTIRLTQTGSGSYTNLSQGTYLTLLPQSAPVLNSPGDQIVNELATFTITNLATDVDLPANKVTYSLVSAPEGVILNPSNGVLSWTPTEAQGPSTNTITVKVTDDGIPPLSDSKSFSVVVNEVNSPPVLIVPSDQTINELTTLIVTNLATDADLPASKLTFSLVLAPEGVSLNPTNGVLTWTPTEAQGPSTNTITVKVTDDGIPPLSDSKSFSVVVNEVNSPPVLIVPSDQTINELTTLIVTNLATDADLPANNLTFSVFSAPEGVSLNPTNGVLTWTPTESQGPSTNTITIKVTDDGIPPLSDTKSFSVVVNEVNSAPVLIVPSDQTMNELTTLTVTNLATDTDMPANKVTFSLVSAPEGVSLNPTNGVLTWTPAEAQGPSTNTITVKVTDDGISPLSDTKSFTVVVNEVNSAPVLIVPSDQTLNEMTTLIVTNLATDADLPANNLTFSLVSAPEGVSLHPSSGVLTWTPTEAQGPSTNTITVKVTDDGIPPLSDTKSIKVMVNEVNIAPVLVVPSDHTMNEMTTLVVTNLATDADLPANKLTFSLVSAPEGVTLNPSNGVLTWTPTEAQGPSTNTITIKVTDDGVPPLSDEKSFTIEVIEANRPPVLTVPIDQTLNELGTLTVTNLATDPDIPTNHLTFSLGVAPDGVSLDPVTGVLTWIPTEAQGPSTNIISVTVTDDGNPPLSDTQSFTVVVAEVNSMPMLNILPDIRIDDLTTLFLTNSVADSDIPTNKLTYSLTSAPLGMTIDPLTGIITWLASETNGPSTNLITVRITDDGSPAMNDSRSFTIVVDDVNQKPALTVPPDQTINELTILTVTNLAVDVDIPANKFSFSLITAPEGVKLDADTGVLTWLPTEAQGPSTNVITVRVTDDGKPPLSDTKSFTVVVNEVNSAPVLTMPSDQTVKEQTTLIVPIQASDADVPANQLKFSLVQAPWGAAIDAVTGVFSWTPSKSQGVGVYTIIVQVTDNGISPLSDAQSFKVTVKEVNQAPVMITPGDQVINELSTLTLPLTAFDQDIPANNLKYSIVSAPSGVVLDTSTGVLAWTPTETQGFASYLITVSVTDDGNPPLSDTRSFSVSVNEVNQAPVLIPPGDQVINELNTLTLPLTAFDQDAPANKLTFSLVSAPSGVVLDASTGVLSWTPTENQGSASYAITVSVTDDGNPPLSDMQSFKVTVNEVNQTPMLIPPGNQVINELNTLVVALLAFDQDIPANHLTFSLISAPSGVVLDAATGVLSWAPTEAQGPSTNTITVQVTDDGKPPLSDTTSFSVIVNEVNSAPVLTLPANQTIEELTTLTVANLATDVDLPANNLSFSLVAGPEGVKLDPATGVLSWTPAETQAPSTNSITIRVTDDGQPPLSDAKSFVVTVKQKPREIRLGIIQPAYGTQILTWTSQIGQRYQVHYKDNLADPFWSTLTEMVATGVTSSITNQAASSPRRFYRVERVK